MNFEICENNIGYSFKNKNLLKEALTHTSYAYENKVKSNERDRKSTRLNSSH